MKLLRSGLEGQEKSGLFRDRGVRNLSVYIDDLSGEMLHDASLAKLRAIHRAGLRVVGTGQNPEVYLRPGNVMELGIDDLGKQEQKVISTP